MSSSSTDMDALWKFWGDLVDDQGVTNGQDYSALTVRELRSLLKERGLPVSGKKSKLITRLENDAAIELSDGAGVVGVAEDYDGKTVKELRKLLREMGLPVSGKKSKLIERLRASESMPPSSDYSKMTVRELRGELRKQGLKVSGNKKALIKRLKNSKTTPNYKYMTVRELRQLLSSRGMRVSGNKASLVNRLVTADENLTSGYTGLSSGFASPTGVTPFGEGDWSVAGKVIAGCLGVVLFIGFVAAMSEDSGGYDDDYSSSSSGSSGSSFSSGSSGSSSGSSGSSSSGDCYYYSSYAGRCLTESEFNCYFVTGGCSLAADFGPNTGYSGDTTSSGSNSCVWAYDGVCDEGLYCSYGTDTFDCG
jgi:hypothetical protein